MKKISYIAALTLIMVPIISQAQLVIKSSAEIHERMRSHMKGAQQASKPSQPLPSFDVLKKSMEQALVYIINQPPGISAPLTHPLLLRHGCNFIAKAPSGIERRSGGLNGISALYQCHDGYMQVYEYDYTRPTKQAEMVIDDEYAKDPVAHRYTVKAFRTERDGKTRTALRWINPDYQIVFEVYPDLDDPAVIEVYRNIIQSTARAILE